MTGCIFKRKLENLAVTALVPQNTQNLVGARKTRAKKGVQEMVRRKDVRMLKVASIRIIIIRVSEINITDT